MHVRVRKAAQRRPPSGGPRARAKRTERATGPLLPSYDVLLSVSALALFAISMFITILVLR